MTNEEVISILNSLKQYYNDNNADSYVGFDDEDNEALDMAIKALEQTRWIPCSERLPKESGDYFATISFDVMGGKEPVREVYKDYFSVLSQKWLYHGEDVIAWVQPPEPYEESEVE